MGAIKGFENRLNMSSTNPEERKAAMWAHIGGDPSKLPDRVLSYKEQQVEIAEFKRKMARKLKKRHAKKRASRRKLLGLSDGPPERQGRSRGKHRGMSPPGGGGPPGDPGGDPGVRFSTRGVGPDGLPEIVKTETLADWLKEYVYYNGVAPKRPMKHPPLECAQRAGEVGGGYHAPRSTTSSSD
jgi:hypothetical protein